MFNNAKKIQERAIKDYKYVRKQLLDSLKDFLDSIKDKPDILDYLYAWIEQVREEEN